VRALGKEGAGVLCNGPPASHPCHGDQTDARCQPIVQANSKAKIPSNHRIAEGHNITAEGEEGPTRTVYCIHTGPVVRAS